MKPFDVREYSYITWGLERIFKGLQWLSLATWILRYRQATPESFADPATDKVAFTKRRGLLIECYIITWFLIEAACVWFNGWATIQLPELITVLATYRLVELLQANLNVTLFERLRSPHPLVVSTISRSVILSMWSFVEAIICFGLIYASHASWLKGANDGLDPYYFSVVTQLTVGYGDISPLAWLRFVAIAQGIMGFILGVFVIARVIALLPKIGSVMGDEKDDFHQQHE